MTVGQADRLLELYPSDPNVFNMLKDVKIYLAWRDAKEAAGVTAGVRVLLAAAAADAVTGEGNAAEEEEHDEEESV